ncbi:MAG: hypothetical protein WC821_01810 [archaeon]
MAEKKPSLDSLVKGGQYCVKCGSEVPKDEVGGKCEIMKCPKCEKKK